MMYWKRMKGMNSAKRVEEKEKNRNKWRDTQTIKRDELENKILTS